MEDHDTPLERSRPLMNKGLDALNGLRLSEATRHFAAAAEAAGGTPHGDLLARIYRNLGGIARAVSAAPNDEVDTVFLLEMASTDSDEMLQGRIRPPAQRLLVLDAIEHNPLGDVRELLEDIARSSDGWGTNVQNAWVHYGRGELAARRGRRLAAAEHFRRPLQPDFEPGSIIGENCSQRIAARGILELMRLGYLEESLELIEKRRQVEFCDSCTRAGPALDIIALRARSRPPTQAEAAFAVDYARDMLARDVGVILDAWRFAALRTLLLCDEVETAEDLWSRYKRRTGRDGWEAALLDADIHLARLRSAVGAEPRDDELDGLDEALQAQRRPTGYTTEIERLADTARRSVEALSGSASQHDARLDTARHSACLDSRFDRIDALYTLARGEATSRQPSTRAFVTFERDGNTRSLELQPGEYVVGRSPDADIQIVDGHIARRHAALVLADGELYLEDFNTRVGVYLLGRRVFGKTRPLREGDLLSMASLVIRIDGIEDRPSRQTAEES